MALKHLSFTLADAEMMFLTGHSGAGKSTILKLITAMEPLSHGSAEVNVRPEIKRRHLAKLRRDIGIIWYIPTNTAPHGFDNVALPLVSLLVRITVKYPASTSGIGHGGATDKEKRFPAACPVANSSAFTLRAPS